VDGFNDSLIIAPVGAYIGRVKRGIEYALGAATIPKRTRVKIILVSSNSWLEQDQGYKDAIKSLRNSFDPESFKGVYPSFQCDEAQVAVDSLESSSVWLLKTLAPFFDANGERGRAYVDLTSAPKEWLFACNYVRSFFADVHFYYVRGKRENFQDFTEQQRMDEGSAAEMVDLGGPNEILRYWITPNDHRYELLKAICTLVSTKAKKSKKSPLEIWVDIAEVADEWKVKSDGTSPRPEDAIRSLGKHFAQIDQWNLLARTPKTVRLTDRGLTLGLALFPGLFRLEQIVSTE